jgi:acetylornithine aminotransferase
MGKVITESLVADAAGAKIREIRGRGLMIGIELQRDCGELVTRALDAGLLINVTAGNTVRLLPPLVISEAEARELADGVARLIRDFD